jgi:hypothetical protein
MRLNTKSLHQARTHLGTLRSYTPLDPQIRSAQPTSVAAHPTASSYAQAYPTHTFTTVFATLFSFGELLLTRHYSIMAFGGRFDFCDTRHNVTYIGTCLRVSYSLLPLSTTDDGQKEGRDDVHEECPRVIFLASKCLERSVSV